MPSGIELILGYPFPVWREKKISKHTGLTVSVVRREIGPEDKLAKIDARLKTAHREALTKMGFRKIKNEKKGSHVFALTPDGQREFSPFSLEFYYQPIDMSDDLDTAIVGVSISSRYFPRFADWRDPHGTFTPMIFDTELKKVQQIAKWEIVKAAPFMSDAVWIVKEIWY